MTAAEVIAEHKRLTDEIATLEAERAKLPKVAGEWVKNGPNEWQERRDVNDHVIAYVFVDENGEWWHWTRGHGGSQTLGRRYALPNTEAGAKACADAQLTADGVLLA